MRNCAWMAIGVCVLATAAGASISNGDFSSAIIPYDTATNVNWAAAVTSGGGTATAAQDLADYAGSPSALRLNAVNHYAWDDGWDFVSGENTSSVFVSQAGIPAVAGQNVLEFDVASIYTNAKRVALAASGCPTVSVGIIYQTSSGPVQISRWYDTNGDWQHVSIPLTDLDPAGGGIAIRFFAGSELSYVEPDGAHNDTMTVDVTGYFDNVVLTPEPATVALLLVGAAALLMRRRRTRA